MGVLPTRHSRQLLHTPEFGIPAIVIFVEAKRCGHSKPPNNRPFMVSCNAMMILLCPPPLHHHPPPPTPTLHQPPQLHRNVVQQVTRSVATTTTTTSPVLPPLQPKPLFSQIKKGQEGKKL
ncbi:hypothetical protein EYF80_006108 [Liparis tanakae]|uniref:Uncharacterized protein n=1 Tax=Liparis tanakae TaxID=230148 RepID=A0A4Z2IZY3_9TELE|nr:hypothetical protein EYF80_006108 [Liparis tanakae]